MMLNVGEIVRNTMGWCPLMSIKNTGLDNGTDYVHVMGLRRNGAPTGRSVIYEELAPYSYTIKLILALGFLALAFSFFFSVFGSSFGFEKAPEQAQLVLLIAVLIYAFAMWSFFSMKFRVTESGIEAVMPPFIYRVPFAEIKEIKTIDNIPWYVGWGVRLWGRKLAFVSMRKSAVAIEKERGFFRKLVLTTREPEEFVRRVKEKLE